MPARAGLGLLGALVLAAALASALPAQESVLDLAGGAPVLARGGGLSWFAESDTPLDVGRVLGGQESERFLPAPDGTVPLGFGTVWIRLVLRNTSAVSIDWSILLDTWSLRSIKLYRPSVGRDWLVSQAGTAEPAALRESPGRAWQFHLDPEATWLLPGRVATIYMRVNAPYSGLRLPVMVGETRQLAARQSGDYLVVAWLSGAYSLLFLVAVALFLGRVERRHALLVALTGLALVLYLAGSGLGAMLIGLTTTDFLLIHGPDLMTVYLAISLALLMQLLRAAELLPRGHLLMRIAVVLLLALTLVELFVPLDLVVGIKVPALLAAILVVGLFRVAMPVLALRRGSRGVWFVLVAFGLDTLASLAWLLQAIGALPGAGLLGYAVLIAGLCQFLVLIGNLPAHRA